MAEVSTSGSAVRVEHVRAGHEVVISGRLDVHTVGDVRRVLHAALAAGAGDLLLHLGEAEV